MEQKFFEFVKSYVMREAESLAQPHNSRCAAALRDYVTAGPIGLCSERVARRAGVERTRRAAKAAQALVDHNWNNANHPLVAKFRG